MAKGARPVTAWREAPLGLVTDSYDDVLYPCLPARPPAVLSFAGHLGPFVYGVCMHVFSPRARVTVCGGTGTGCDVLCDTRVDTSFFLWVSVCLSQVVLTANENEDYLIKILLRQTRRPEVRMYVLLYVGKDRVRRGSSCCTYVALGVRSTDRTCWRQSTYVSLSLFVWCVMGSANARICWF